MTSEFAVLSRLVRQRSGVVLGPEKEYLVRSRLEPLALRAGGTLEKLAARVAADDAGPVADEIVEALLNNETWFFRDPATFEALRSAVLPELAERGRRPLRIWSAACASGQEPYSVAMLVASHFPHLAPQVEIYATDLSGRMLARAADGLYTQLEVNRGLPAAMLVRHFEEEGECWRVRDELRRHVYFERCNLVGDWGSLPEMDIVLLRNVLIYFDDETRRAVLERMAGALRPDGFLFLGAAEATFPLAESFLAVRAGRAAYHRVRGAEVGP